MRMSVSEDIAAIFRSRGVQALALALLLSAAAWQETQMPSITADQDIWMHLALGDWMYSHHAVPETGILSQIAMRPWAAYSWGFELLVSGVYALAGLMGLLALLAGMEVLITGAIFIVLRRISGSFWPAWSLTGAGIWTLYHNMPIRPIVFSILFFTIAIGLIFEARRTGSVKPLYWLPPLFVLWANVHIQFVYGLAVVGLFVVIRLVRAASEKMGWYLRLKNGDSEIPLVPLLAVGGACILAPLLGPYGIGLYRVIFDYAQAGFVYARITETAAADFRSSAHYAQLLITMAACFALGRKSRDPYRIALLVLTTLYGYRMTRDAWFACIPALVLTASAFRSDRSAGKIPAFGRLRAAGVGAGVVLVLFGAFRISGVSEKSLKDGMGAHFPVQAADFIRREKLPGPLYNTFNYGSFLAWYLPEYPVSIDGRTDLYGEEIAVRFDKVLMGATDPAKDPDMMHAGVVLLQKGFPLSSWLLSDPGFKLVHQDANSYVFVRSQ